MVGAIKRLTDNGGARHYLDKFYTNNIVAGECIESIIPLIKLSDIIVEPAAGNGSFSKQINHSNLKSYDIEPEFDGIEKISWFDIDRTILGEGSLTVLGNPPFGVRSDLAKKFIKHAVFLEADNIAFILPKTFSKTLNQNEYLFPKEYRLVLEKDIPLNSFIINGKSFHIPCGWYVWTKNEKFLPEVDLRKKVLSQPNEFIFVNRGSDEADFVLNGNNGLVKDINKISNPKSEHYIRITDREKVIEFRTYFEKLDFVFHSSVNGGIAWIGKQEIIAAYNLFLKNTLS